MRRYILYVLLFFCFKGALSQNLIVNPGFEDTISCEEIPNSSLFACNTWFYPNTCVSLGGSVEYFNFNCYGGGFLDSPMPHAGDSYVGFHPFYFSGNQDENREYIEGKLMTPLALGEIYSVSLWLRLSNRSKYAIKNLSVVFSVDSLLYCDINYGTLVWPDKINNTNLLNDSTNWQKIELIYVANGNEKYLTIGNFDTYTNTIYDYDSSKTVNAAYYYIDDVSVIEIDTNMYDISIFPNPNDGNFTVNYNLGDEETGMFYLYDAIGRKVYKKELEQNNGTLQIELLLSSGVYIWEVRGNKRVQSGKIVIVD